MAKYCGKHDKCFHEGDSCFGCDTEKQKAIDDHAENPDDYELTMDRPEK